MNRRHRIKSRETRLMRRLTRISNRARPFRLTVPVRPRSTLTPEQLADQIRDRRLAVTALLNTALTGGRFNLNMARRRARMKLRIEHSIAREAQLRAQANRARA